MCFHCGAQLIFASSFGTSGPNAICRPRMIQVHVCPQRRPNDVKKLLCPTATQSTVEFRNEIIAQIAKKRCPEVLDKVHQKKAFTTLQWFLETLRRKWGIQYTTMTEAELPMIHHLASNTNMPMSRRLSRKFIADVPQAKSENYPAEARDFLVYGPTTFSMSVFFTCGFTKMLGQ